MTIHLRANLSVQRLPTPDDVMPMCELCINGSGTGTMLEGAILEAALEWNGHLLVLLTDDILHEDSLHVYLLDPHLKLLDSGTLGAMYSTGALSDLTLTGPDTIEFEFIGGVPWTVELLDRRRCGLFRLPRKAVRRPLQRYRYFELYSKRTPLPQV